MSEKATNSHEEIKRQPLTLGDFQTRGGVSVLNKSGECFLWVKQKIPSKGNPYALFCYRRDLVDVGNMTRAETAFAYIKHVAKLIGLPMYDFAEITEQLRKHMESMKTRVKVGAKIKEDVELKVTDAVTGRTHKLTVGVSAIPIDEAKKRGLIED